MAGEAQTGPAVAEAPRPAAPPRPEAPRPADTGQPSADRLREGQASLGTTGLLVGLAERTQPPAPPSTAESSEAVVAPSTVMSPEDAAEATRMRQENAYNEIQGLGYPLTADTDAGALLDKLAGEKGWQKDEATKAHINDAIEHAKAQAPAASPEPVTPPATTGPDASPAEAATAQGDGELPAAAVESTAPNPEVQALRTEIAGLKAQIAEMRSAFGQFLEQQAQETTDPKKRAFLRTLIELIGYVAVAMAGEVVGAMGAEVTDQRQAA